MEPMSIHHQSTKTPSKLKIKSDLLSDFFILILKSESKYVFPKFFLGALVSWWLNPRLKRLS
jgi:hypothetical protein